MEKLQALIKLIIVIVIGGSFLLGSLVGCSSNYEFGDISKAYCNSTDKEFREQIKGMLKDKGVDIGVDYCSAYSVIDTLVVKDG